MSRGKAHSELCSLLNTQHHSFASCSSVLRRALTQAAITSSLRVASSRVGDASATLFLHVTLTGVIILQSSILRTRSSDGQAVRVSTRVRSAASRDRCAGIDVRPFLGSNRNRSAAPRSTASVLRLAFRLKNVTSDSSHTHTQAGAGTGVHCTMSHR